MSLQKQSAFLCGQYRIMRLAPATRKKWETYYKMAEVLKVDVNYLLTDDEEFLLNAESKYGSKGARQAKELMAEVTGLFAGGELADEDLDEMMKGIQEAYWIAKEKNKKYTPKKYRK